MPQKRGLEAVEQESKAVKSKHLTQYVPKKPVPEALVKSKGVLLRTTYRAMGDGDDDDDEDNDVNEEEAGYISCIKIVFNDFEMCDDLDADLGQVSVLINKLGEGKCPINEVGDYDEILQGTQLFVQELVVHDAYRGLGLGLFMLHQAINVIGEHMSLTLLCPNSIYCTPERDQVHPWTCKHDHELTPQDIADREQFRKRIKAGNAKLEQHYRLLGFGKISLGGENDPVFMGVWSGYNLPSMATVCPHLLDSICKDE